MAINLIYRSTSNPTVPDHIITANGPLTLEQIDGNMKSISDSFERVDDRFQSIDIEISKKANASNPVFLGSIQIPAAPTTSLSKNAPDGSVVYDTTKQALVVRIGGKWHTVSTDTGLAGYVSRQGDIMDGKLTGPSAEFYDGIKTLPPDGERGDPTDNVATVEWTDDLIDVKINNRIGTDTNTVIADKIVANKQLTVSKGDIEITNGDLHAANVYAKRLWGNIDLGTLP